MESLNSSRKKGMVVGSVADTDSVVRGWDSPRGSPRSATEGGAAKVLQSLLTWLITEIDEPRWSPYRTIAICDRLVWAPLDLCLINHEVKKEGTRKYRNNYFSLIFIDDGILDHFGLHFSDCDLSVLGA